VALCLGIQWKNLTETEEEGEERWPQCKRKKNSGGGEKGPFSGNGGRIT